MNDLPSLPGSYALHLRLDRPYQARVGRLGEALFPPGEYIYLGSAHGPGGLAARLGRHLRQSHACRWHIDYLQPAAIPIAYAYQLEIHLPPTFPAVTRTTTKPDRPACFTGSRQPLECLWSQSLAAQADAFIPLKFFGAGDCRCGCPAHLVAFPSGKSGLLTSIPLTTHWISEPLKNGARGDRRSPADLS